MYQYTATIVRVIDGDTAVLDVDLGFYIVMKSIHFRFVGIDTPERGKPGADDATQFVREFFMDNPTVTINCHGTDKYGRWLAEIVNPTGGTLNKMLVDNKLAVVYMPL